MRYLLLSLTIALLTGPAAAGTIQRACLDAPRAGSPHLCSCIQSAADRTLTNKDQRLAARFFDDPDMAQEIRQSDRQSHEVFWKRYRNFGKAAEAFCS